jgi:hypothetical protein
MKKILAISFILLLLILYAFLINKHIELKFLVSHLNSEKVNNELLLKSNMFYNYSNLTLFIILLFIILFIHLYSRTRFKKQ